MQNNSIFEDKQFFINHKRHDESKMDDYDVDIVFSFDTTGSMASVIQSVRENLQEIVDRLFKDIPNLRVGMIAHGDYCDYPNMMWKMDLSNNIGDIKSFVKNSLDTNGGDYPECYEYVLYSATRYFDWKSNVKILVVIGDAPPHNNGYILPKKMVDGDNYSRKLDINWREEVKKCKENNIIIFSCHALPDTNDESKHFYHTISKETNGYYFCLNELSAFKDYMVAICLQAADGAETISLLKKRQLELEEELKNMDRQFEERGFDEKSEMYKEYICVSQAVSDIERGEVFSSPSVQTSATKVRTKYSSVSRLENYRKEIESVDEKVRSTGHLVKTFTRLSSESTVSPPQSPRIHDVDNMDTPTTPLIRTRRLHVPPKPKKQNRKTWKEMSDDNEECDLIEKPTRKPFKMEPRVIYNDDCTEMQEPYIRKKKSENKDKNSK